MLNLFVNGEGGLTTAGYALSAALLVLSILAGLALADRGGKKGFAAKQLAYCAMAVALAYVTSFIRCPTRSEEHTSELQSRNDI